MANSLVMRRSLAILKEQPHDELSAVFGADRRLREVDRYRCVCCPSRAVRVRGYRPVLSSQSYRVADLHQDQFGVRKRRVTCLEEGKVWDGAMNNKPLEEGGRSDDGDVVERPAATGRPIPTVPLMTARHLNACNPWGGRTAMNRWPEVLAELRRAAQGRRGRSRAVRRPVRADPWLWIMVGTATVVAGIVVIAIRLLTTLHWLMITTEAKFATAMAHIHRPRSC
jgi:hypothetical protein